MATIIVVWIIIIISVVLMLIKWPIASIGYIYGIAVGLMLAFWFLYPYAAETNEVSHCMTLGGGIGAMVGLLCALAIHSNEGSEVGAIIGSLILAPIAEFIIGFVVIVVMGLVLMIQGGQAGTVIPAGIIMFGLISCIIGGGGSIIMIIIDG